MEGEPSVIRLEWEKPRHGFGWTRARLDLEAGLPTFVGPHGFRSQPINESSLKALASLLEYPGKQWVLHDTPLDEAPFSRIGGRYEVFEDHPQLFEEFAQLRRNRAAILDFADRYGFLGVGGVFTRGKHQYYGEPLVYWWREIRELEKAYSFWVNATKYNRGWLRKHIKFSDRTDFVEIRWRGRTDSLHWDVGLEPDLLKDIRAEKREYERQESKKKKQKERATGSSNRRKDKEAEIPLVRPAYVLIKQMVEHAFFRHEIYPRLQWNAVLPVEHTPLQLTLQPRTLIAALWYQLAAAATGYTELRKCPGCGRMFPVGSGLARSDKKTCGETCRKRLQRR